MPLPKMLFYSPSSGPSRKCLSEYEILLYHYNILYHFLLVDSINIALPSRVKASHPWLPLMTSRDCEIFRRVVVAQRELPPRRRHCSRGCAGSHSVCSFACPRDEDRRHSTSSLMGHRTSELCWQMAGKSSESTLAFSKLKDYVQVGLRMRSLFG